MIRNVLKGSRLGAQIGNWRRLSRPWTRCSSAGGASTSSAWAEPSRAIRLNDPECFEGQSAGCSDRKLAQVESALDEMLFSGGSLNVKRLGGAVQGDSAE